MPTLRLIPSAYSVSNVNYLIISNEANMYTNVDSTTYATAKHNRSSTTSYYLYIKGFDFSQVPSNAILTSAIIKVKANVTNAGENSPALYNNTTSLSQSLNGTIGTSVQVRTADITQYFETYKGYGENFGIRLRLNRSSSNNASTLNVYGAEITVDYEVAQHNVNFSITKGILSTSNPLVVDDASDASFEFYGEENTSFKSMTINNISNTPVQNENIYTYTIKNVTEDKNVDIVFEDNTSIAPTPSPQTNNFYIKINGVWNNVNECYKKENGIWNSCLYEYDQNKNLIYKGHITSSGSSGSNFEEGRFYITEDSMITQHPDKVVNGNVVTSIDSSTNSISLTFSATGQGVLLNAGNLTGSDNVRVYFDDVLYSESISDTAKNYIGIYDGSNYTNSNGMTPFVDATDVGIQINSSSRYVVNGGILPITVTYKNFRYEKL